MKRDMGGIRGGLAARNDLDWRGKAGHGACMGKFGVDDEQVERWWRRAEKGMAA